MHSDDLEYIVEDKQRCAPVRLRARIYSYVRGAGKAVFAFESSVLVLYTANPGPWISNVIGGCGG
jgi:hypothetical protein